MGEPITDASRPTKLPEDRLDSWKEIAAYLNRDVTTVQRWEKREAMPVHRHLHDKRGSVYASRAELDAWARTRKLRATPESEDGDDSAGIAPQASRPEFSTAHIRSKLLLWFFTVVAAFAIALGLWLERKEYFWRSPIAQAKFQTVTDFEGVEQAATVSRDGQFVAFLSDRDGHVDVYITQVGSGQFHNLTRGNAPEITNPLLRTLGFSPDGSLVTFWGRQPVGSTAGNINVWAVPTLGGQPKLYLEGVAEYDWSRDGSRLAYHTPGPGDPLFVSDGGRRAGDQPIFTAPPGLHAHFQLWSPDKTYIYFVQGYLPDKLDIWRIRPSGGPAERITSHNGRVTHPVFLDRRTLLYLSSDADGSGPWLYSMDVEHRIPHRLNSGLDRYTSLAASADGHRLVATLTSPKKTLWRLRLTGSTADSAAVPIALTTGTGFSPRLGPNFVLYVSATGTSESIWKTANGTAAELWKEDGARVIGAPAVSPDGKNVAFSVRKDGRPFLYVMQADGTKARIVTDALDLQGAPTWVPDGHSLTTAATDRDVPHLYRVPLDGPSPRAFLDEYSLDPAWAPDGRFVVYSGPDIGTKFTVKAITPEAAPHFLPALTMTRGSRHLAFLQGGESIVLLQGELQHKNLWLFDLKTGAQRQLTNFPHDFEVRDFDISPDSTEVVLERVEERSSVVLVDVPEP